MEKEGEEDEVGEMEQRKGDEGGIATTNKRELTI
jgi:hypothetical protein